MNEINDKIITGKMLKQRGWPEGKIIGLAKAAAETLSRMGMEREAILSRLDEVREKPGEFLAYPLFAEVAREALRRESVEVARIDDALRVEPLDYKIWGAEGIDAGALEQMRHSLTLPIAVAGALMPDAHVGYGLPIGGVLATQGAVIPYAVGVDIACFTGDTLIPLADGKQHSLKELAESGREFVVYSCTASGRVVAASATAHQTRKNAPLLKVELDNGEVIRCTPDHRFLLRDGSYLEARRLQPNDSLMPFYTQQDKEGYTMIQQNYSGYWQRAHWLIARSGLLGVIPRFEGQRTVIHHKNFDEQDNRPENLEFMGDKDHSYFHRLLVDRNTHWQSEEFEQHRKAALSAKAQTPEGHAYFASRGSRNLLRYWREHPELAKANCAGNGQRGKVYLVAKNQSAAGRAKSSEIANRMYECETCGEKVKSPIGLHNHRWHQHHYNHKVISVTALEERADVYCLAVPKYENFALSAGVFVHNCRMRLSIYDMSPHVLGQRKSQFEKALMDQTHFGMGASWSKTQRPDHEVLDESTWKATRLLKSLQGKAAEQLGTSGTGNHFVEWGVLSLEEDSADLNLKAGQYLALLSHSGSRGVGFKIANEYSKIARGLHPMLTPAVRNLAWLPLQSQPGEEYWLSMELAGRFASANHAIIHRRVAKAVGIEEVARVENHHNFAWRETLADGSTAIVHRKGATPAGPGVLGVIPGSMGDPGYVVRGKGLPESINSASHGAGRRMGRKQAINSLTKGMRDKYLQERGVTLLGGGIVMAAILFHLAGGLPARRRAAPALPVASSHVPAD